jgi:hypothetical protein
MEHMESIERTPRISMLSMVQALDLTQSCQVGLLNTPENAPFLLTMEGRLGVR